MNKYKTAIRALETRAYYPIKLWNDKQFRMRKNGLKAWITVWYCRIGKATGIGESIAEAVQWAVNNLKEFNETSCESCAVKNCDKEPERAFSTCEDWREVS